MNTPKDATRGHEPPGAGLWTYVAWYGRGNLGGVVRLKLSVMDVDEPESDENKHSNYSPILRGEIRRVRIVWYSWGDVPTRTGWPLPELITEAIFARSPTWRDHRTNQNYSRGGRRRHLDRAYGQPSNTFPELSPAPSRSHHNR